jgi:hypothetical protein
MVIFATSTVLPTTSAAVVATRKLAKMDHVIVEDELRGLLEETEK